MTTLLRRLIASTPPFWRKAQKRATLIGLTIGGMITSGHMPEALLPYLQYAAFACGIVIIVAQATCDTPPSPPTDPEDQTA